MVFRNVHLFVCLRADDFLQVMKKRVHIVVLGDIGRSPRMKYHAWSFSQEGWEVRLSGYAGSRLHQAFEANGAIELGYIAQPPKWIDRVIPRALALLMKLIYLFFSLFFHLLFSPWSPFIMLQTPPAVPSFLVVRIVSWLRGIRLIVDWHNYGYSIMTLSLGGWQHHPLTMIYTLLEGNFASHCLRQETTLHFCVSKALKHDLLTRWRIPAKVLYDRPGPFLERPSVDRSHQLFVRLGRFYPEAFGYEGDEGIDFMELDTHTRFTTCDNAAGAGEGARWRRERPQLLVSSTSWTPDEDFSLLFDALGAYNARCDAAEETGEEIPPDVVCVITGKGPLKEAFAARVQESNWLHVTVVMPWLEAEDYPVLIGSADLGVSLHSSSSGLDLPMKVVDMFGLRVPVLAHNFPALKELVQERHNGRVFESSSQLAEQVQFHLGSAEGRQQLEQFRQNLEQYAALGWHQNWRHTLLPRVENSLR